MNYLGDPDKTYTTGDGSVLRSYTGKDIEEFRTLCRLLTAQGWECLSDYAENGSVFATYRKGNELCHFYIPADRENTLRVVRSDHANLPEAPTVTGGTKETTVTQLQLPLTETNIYSNGMGYVVRLADGSFLIFDGGYAEQADQLWQTLVKQNGGEEGIVIRAWCLTHAHSDHYGILQTFASRYAGKVTLERFIAAPVNGADAADPYFNVTLPKVIAQYAGAVLTVPHTGMVFRFCNLTLEILFTPDERLIEGKPENFDFNSSGTVYRLSGDGDRMLFLGDVLNDVTSRLQTIWGDHLRTNMVQVAHHGVGNSPLAFYESLGAKVLFYPAGHLLYGGENGDFGESRAFADNWRRNGAVRKALAESGKYEILLHDENAYLRVWGSSAPAQIFTID